MSETNSLFVSIVTYRDASYLKGCVDSLLALEGYELGKNLAIEVVHNGILAADEVKGVAEALGVVFRLNAENLGFAAAHNQGASSFLASNKQIFLVLNPDLALYPDSAKLMVKSLFAEDKIGIVTPLLLRADEKLKPLVPNIIDAAGMIFTSSLRHFDRFSEQLVDKTILSKQEVAGATGACLMIKRKCLEDMLLKGTNYDQDLFQVFPELALNYEQRAPFFDESFFAYREDAELSLRASVYGYKIIFDPNAIGCHVRKVTPARRLALPTEINLHSVRNRFLLQIIHWYPYRDLHTFISGMLMRNLLVLLTISIFERTSLTAITQVIKLFPRALERRRMIMSRAKNKSSPWVNLN